MMALTLPFPAHQPHATADLSLSFISLEEWSLVNVSGVDATKYLQGQLTADINQLTAEQHILCAHCEAKGKTLSNLRLFRHHDDFCYLVRSSVLEKQLAAIRKYAVFSKVSFEHAKDAVLLGIAGTKARAVLTKIFTTLPDEQQQIVCQQETTLLHFSCPQERFLIITTLSKAEQLAQILTGQSETTNSSQWLALDIAAGFAIIDETNSEKFIPQALNLQALAGGISFNKGCYSGQEMVARAKFRGANKRALYWLAGNAEQVPQVGAGLELQLEENWRQTGTVLAAVKLTSGILWVQAVLANDLDTSNTLRVSGDNTSQLHIQALPYSLEK